jgi:hypothetical protein
MAAAAAPAILRQYEIQIGPFTNNLPHRVLGINPMTTNVSYFKATMLGGALPIGIIFSRGGFITNSRQTLAPVRSLWVINLTPIRISTEMPAFPLNAVQSIPKDNLLHPLLTPGAITHLAWGQKFILQPENRDVGVLIRAVDLMDDGEISDVPPFHVHNGNPNQMLPTFVDQEGLEMPGLLCRLQDLTN